jgi:cytoskeleton protein RodZ
MLSHGEGTTSRQTAQVEMPPLPPPPEVAPDAQTASSGAKPAEQVAAATPPVPSPEQTEQLDGLAALIEQNVPENGTATPAAKPAAVPETTASIAPGESASTPPAADGSRLTLRAKGPVWVRIEDANGNVVMTQMLMPGDTYQVPNREGLVVIARDGGLLAYLIDGKEKGILGPPGEILVGRPLDIKQLDQQG